VGVELADHRRIICSLTVGDDDATAQLLIDALLVLDQQQSSATQPTIGALVDPEIAMNPRVALQQRSESVSIKDSANQICAEYLIPYPPGIPLVAPGERITKEVLASLESFQQSGARIVGPADPTLARVQVVTGTTSG
jgi:arginine decarboxylase